MLGLAHGLGLDCVAEGVEDESQVAQLLAMGCARGQGYLFAAPQPAGRLLVQAPAGSRSVVSGGR